MLDVLVRGGKKLPDRPKPGRSLTKRTLRVVRGFAFFFLPRICVKSRRVVRWKQRGHSGERVQLRERAVNVMMVVACVDDVKRLSNVQSNGKNDQ